MAFRHPALFLILLSACQLSLQSSLFSLQPAVDALNSREAQLALRDELADFGDLEDFPDSEVFEWSNDYDMERGQHAPPNRALARYFARPNADYDIDNYPGYRKRFMLRKRDGSVFRERSRLPVQRQQQAELAEKFLKAIEDEREREREEEYREQLKNLWSRYQREEDDIEKELFSSNENENDAESDYPVNYEDIYRKKKKRQRGEAEVAPTYWSDKRSMPLLPWLPATRKKRFPVTKRSPKSESEVKKVVLETSDKISKDLEGIFGDTENLKKAAGDDKKKKKRSSEEDVQPTTSVHDDSTRSVIEQHSSTSEPASSDEKKRNVKRSAPDEEDDENDNEGEDDGDDEPNEPGEDDSDEDEYKKKKKKREVKKSLSESPEKKFSVKRIWSNLFGYDRKKKSMMLIDSDMKRRKKSAEKEEDPDTDYEEPEEYYDSSEDDSKRKKRSGGLERLNAMERKLKTIENLIIEDTAKHFDQQHDENLNPSEVRGMKSKLADRLATVYSLEKMRRAIARLKQSMAFQNNMEKNLLEMQVNGPADDGDEKKKAKRVAVKKEKAEFDNNEHEIDPTNVKKVSGNAETNTLDSDDEEKKKKKKRSQKKNEISNVINDEAHMSEGYMGGRAFQNNCPLLDAIEKRCRGIDILTGDSHQSLLEACGAHQLCYLCGDSETQCDYGFLYDVQDICGHNTKCKVHAAEALTALRNFSGSKVGPRECVRNPCLNSALRSIGY